MTIQNNIRDFESLSQAKMFYVSNATWEGVNGFLEKIKRMCRGVARVIVCCDSDRKNAMLCFFVRHTALYSSIQNM